MDEAKESDVPGRLYRFRPLSVVKPTVVEGEIVEGKTLAQELEKREIFIDRLDELNDPMDGLHHTVWDGDSAVWENFVRNYSMCFLDTVAYVQIAGDTATFDTSVINTLKTAEDCPTDEYRALYDDLIKRVESNSELQALLRELCRRQKLRHEELRALLSMYQPHFLREVARAITSHLDSNPLPGIEHLSGNTDLRSLAAILPLIGDQVLGVSGELGQRTNEQLYLIQRYNSRETNSTGKDNLTRLIAMFPAYYLDAAAEDIHGEFYVASFAKSAEDSSMWAHYAEQHRGVCLIFEAPEVDGQRVIELDGNRKAAVYPVNYDDSRHGSPGDLT
jgi:hypothetical protein